MVFVLISSLYQGAVVIMEGEVVVEGGEVLFCVFGHYLVFWG